MQDEKQSTGNIELQIEKSSRWPGMAFPTPGNRIPDAWERHSQPVGNAPLQSGRHLYGRVGLAPCTHLLHCSWLWRRKFPASRPITLRTYMNARLPAMRKALYAASASNVPSPHAKQTGADAARLHLPLQRLEDSAASAPILLLWT